jgi:CRP-like cAMP-binding protein
LELFRDIAEVHLQRLAENARLVEFPAQRDIFRENDVAKEVYLIVSGRVSLVICRPKIGCRQLMEVGEGELLGWSSLVGRHRLSDTAHTLTPTKTLAFDGQQVISMCKELPDFGFQLMHRVAQVLEHRLNATRLQLLEMCGVHLPDVQVETD